MSDKFKKNKLQKGKEITKVDKKFVSEDFFFIIFHIYLFPTVTQILKLQRVKDLLVFVDLLKNCK